MKTHALKIIAIDDELAVIRLINRVCRDIGSFEGFTSAEAGLAAVQSTNTLDLIIIDLEMGDIYGLDLIAQIRKEERYRDIPIIVFTGSDSDTDEGATLRSGASDFVRKPVSADVLKLRIKMHLENRMLRKELEALATTDSLTGLINRRGAEEHLRREVRRSFRAQEPLSIAILDIDHFKSVNDSYGHPTGDETLRRVAAALARQFQRSSDLVARIGGEEFLIASSAMRDAEFAALIEQSRESVKTEVIKTEDARHGFSATISAGAVTATPQLGESLDEFVAALWSEADRALYKAKQTRDRLVVTEHEPVVENLSERA